MTTTPETQEGMYLSKLDPNLRPAVNLRANRHGQMVLSHDLRTTHQR